MDRHVNIKNSPEPQAEEGGGRQTRVVEAGFSGQREVGSFSNSNSNCRQAEDQSDATPVSQYNYYNSHIKNSNNSGSSNNNSNFWNFSPPRRLSVDSIFAKEIEIKPRYFMRYKSQ